MRLRHIRGAEEAITSSLCVIQQPTEHRGPFNELFGNANPIEIAVGMGKGKFIMELAQKHPETNFIGIERYSSVLLRALQKREELEIPNIYFMCVDAKELGEIFAPGEVEKIYLNFSDPWPKDRHAKRRLTSRQFLERYHNILKEEGRVIFKTDNRPLFDFSLEEVKEAGWTLEKSTFDLPHSEYVEGNIMTEYERKFSGFGEKINRCEVTFTKQDKK